MDAEDEPVRRTGAGDVGREGDRDVRRAIDLAYRALSARDRTESELRAFLERKRAAPAAIGMAIEELRAAGYVDDARYARRFAEDKRSIERWGSERIERDLRRRGVAAHLIEAALVREDAGAERSAALSLLGERFRAGLPDERSRDRAWRLLVRRGYDPELAYEAVRAHERRIGSEGWAA